MEHPNQNMEFAVWFSLKQAGVNTEKAINLATAKYESMEKRPLNAQERTDLKQLVHELVEWQQDQIASKSTLALI